MRSKHVCFLISNISNGGGTERVSALIANALVNKGYQVSFISMLGSGSSFFELNPNVSVLSLKVKSIKKDFFNIIFKVRNIVKNNKIDTLIVVDSISVVFSSILLFGLKVKHICWEHFNYTISLGIIYRKVGRYLASRKCDYIVTLTGRDKILWQTNLKNIRAKIIAIPNPSSFPIQSHTPRLENKTVISIGRLTYQKGFDMLIQAWANIVQDYPDWKLIIVGDGEDEAVLHELANTLISNNSIKFVPSTKDISSYYSRASVYCLSSRFEGLPMVLLEAQAFGLPIVAFDCLTGPSEIIINNHNGYLVNDGNVIELSLKLKDFLGISNVTYNNLVDNSFEVVKKYTVDSIIEKWLDILEH